ncbi:MAG: BrnT family toxin [Thermoanaerobaculia bacterium]
MRFEWDEAKATSNSRKHGVSFEEAKTVFDDPLAAIFDDEQHSVEEQREIIIGHSGQSRLLLVCFTERRRTIRIFSARPATRHEQKDYEEGIDSLSF